MAKKTSVTITAHGVDKTRGMFASVKANVSKLGAQTKKIALSVAAGVGVGVGALVGVGATIRSVSKELSTLSDRAAQCGTSAGDLRKMVDLFNEIGVKNVSIDTLTDAMNRMTKATGRVGKEGFLATLKEISAMETEQEKVVALTNTMGRAFGPGLLAIVRKPAEEIEAGFEGLMATMPTMSENLIQRADDIADGFNRAGAGIRDGWQSFWSQIATNIVDQTEQSGRQSGAKVAAYAKYAMEVAGAHVGAFVRNGIEFFRHFRENWKALCDWMRDSIQWSVEQVVFRLHALFEKLTANLVYIKEYWAALFTDDSVDAAMARYQAKIDQTNRELQQNLSLSKLPDPVRFVGEYVHANVEGLKEALDETLASIPKLETYETQFASAVTAPVVEAAEEAGKAFADKVSKELKNATWAEAGFQSLRIERQRLAGSLSIAGPGGSRETRNANAETAKAAKEQKAILSRLVELLAVQREGWSGIHGTLAKIGTI